MKFALLIMALMWKTLVRWLEFPIRKGAESRQFVWTPQPRDSDRGWRVLGASRLNEETIEVRLLSADCA